MANITWGDIDRYVPDRYVMLISSAGTSVEDSSTGAIPTIDFFHKKIHSGDHFFVCSAETLASGSSAVFGCVTPNSTRWSHMMFECEGTTQTEMYIYEDSTFTGGSVATPLNNNRNSVKTATLSVYKNPTVTNLGTQLFFQSKGLEAATPSKASNEGLFSREKEIILKQNTKYIFKFISRGADNILSYCGEWYEHTNL